MRRVQHEIVCSCVIPLIRDPFSPAIPGLREAAAKRIDQAPWHPISGSDGQATLSWVVPAGQVIVWKCVMPG